MTLFVVTALYLATGQMFYAEKPMASLAACHATRQATATAVKQQFKPDGAIVVAVCLQGPSL